MSILKKRWVKIVLVIVVIIAVFLGGVMFYMSNQELIKKPRLMRNYPAEEYQDKVLLAGSSFMENWETSAEDLEKLDTLNLAIGGTTVSDWQDMYMDLIVPYNPEAVVIYVGSNDIDGSSKSKTGDAVFAEIETLFESISAELGDTPIIYVSIAPTIARENVWDDSSRCNELMSEYCEQNENYYFIDCTDALLAEDGSLRDNIYGMDNLHFNEEGYEIWASVLQPYLYEFFSVE